MFRRSAADLQGAALRVHITLTIGSVPVKESAEAVSQMGCDSQGELLSEEAEEADQVPSPTTSKTPDNNKFSGATPVITSVQNTELNLDESFPVTVAVDCAMHLNLKGEPLTKTISLAFKPNLQCRLRRVLCVSHRLSSSRPQ